MAEEKINVEKTANIHFNMPDNNAKNSNENLSEREIALKDKLIKLIIDTKDEDIELKINGEQYRKIGIHDEWRQVDFNSSKAAYFSYQEKAAKDFIYRFNKCGILSDQVGMGKTIEAGMIISELAYRKELGSLLILVPNENMAEKWETELARKFGFRNFYKALVVMDGNEEKTISPENLPKVASIKSLEDLYSIIYSAYDSLHNKVTLDKKIKSCAREYFDEFFTSDRKKSIKSKIDALLNEHTETNSKEFKMAVIKTIYAPIITSFVEAVSKKLGYSADFEKSGYTFNITGTYYHIVDMYLDTPILNSSLSNGIMQTLIDPELISESLVGEFKFIKSRLGTEVIKKINDKIKKSSDEQSSNYIEDFREISKEIRKQYAILIVSKLVTHLKDEHFNLLNFCLNSDYESESMKHCSMSSIIEKGYYVMDLLIDMAYKTLIVDEAHDYIKVSHKQKMRDDITEIKDYEKRQREAIEFSDVDMTANNTQLKYYVFPLYNDYYFVEKDCMYLKVKALAERSYRKIFMTATPIKSDMIDFYLLYFLTDNSDTFILGIIRRLLKENQISEIAKLLMQVMSDNQKKVMNYATYEDLVVKYIYEYYRQKQPQGKMSTEEKLLSIVNNVIETKTINQDILSAICINQVRLQFQNMFTLKNPDTMEDVEINSISDLVSSDEGIEQWQNMYSQIGIRSTRHQTFRLDDQHLDMIKPVQRNKYRNLPVWARRNGTIIYIHKKDNFFDLIVKEKLDYKKKNRLNNVNDDEKELRYETIEAPKARETAVYEKKMMDEIQLIKDEDYTEKLTESKIKEAQLKFENEKLLLEDKYAPKETAMNIYNYINDQLSGTLNVADYYSTDVDYDDFKLHMVAKLMTDGLEVENLNQPKKIDGKVLLFADDSTQKKVLDWLVNECIEPENKMTDSELASYISHYKHPPLWYYNSLRDNDEDKWVITTDIKALKEKKGNYLIVVEPNKYEEGVDLQSSDTLINFDIKFCPLKMEQRIGRIDRVKLSNIQPQLDIISFTPLNDMSGFMVDFLANELQMFSCWKGDTTGIVSMPLGEKPNSATFESAILAINEAYKNLYEYDSKKFISSLKHIVEMGKNFSNNNFSYIEKILENEKQIFDDFKYLTNSSKHVNTIIFNSDSSDNTNGDDGFIVFDELCFLTKKKAYSEGNISKESISNHKNDMNELKNAIDKYYTTNLNYLRKEIRNIKNAYSSDDESGSIGTDNSMERYNFERLKDREQEFMDEYNRYLESDLYKLPKSSLGIEKRLADIALNPVLDRFRKVVNNYLDTLIDLFDKFCADVTDKSKKMTKFISYLTIEEFRVMAGNYE